MKQLSIRNVGPELAAALEDERRRRGTSLNRTVLELLRQAVGLSRLPFDNGLKELAGSWSEEELREFEEATAIFEEVDEELWR